MGNFSDQSYSKTIDTPLNHPEIMEKQLGRDKHPLFEWWALWANANSIWEAGVTGEPYPVKGAVCQSGDFMNMGNTTMAWETLQQLDFMFDIDLWHHPTSEMADIILPCTHWLEIACPRQSQGSGGALGACVPCVEPLAEARYDPEIVEELYRRVGLPWGWDENNPYPTLEEKLDYVVREVSPSWEAFVNEFQENGWWDVKKIRPDDWGTYYRFQTGFMKKAYTDEPTASNVIPGFNTPTMKQEIWCTIMETFHGAEDALPDYRPNPDSRDRNPELWDEYPVQCLTGRRIPVYFHSEHRAAAVVPQRFGRYRAWRSTRRMPPSGASNRATGCGSKAPTGRSARRPICTTAFRGASSTASTPGGIRKCPPPSTVGAIRRSTSWSTTILTTLIAVRPLFAAIR